MAPTEAERLAKLETDVTNVRDDIAEMKDRLIGRPSWAVATYITLMTAIVSGLAVALATTGFR